MDNGSKPSATSFRAVFASAISMAIGLTSSTYTIAAPWSLATMTRIPGAGSNVDGRLTGHLGDAVREEQAVRRRGQDIAACVQPHSCGGPISKEVHRCASPAE